VFANPDNADRIALVAHGGSLNVLMKFLLDLPLKPGACFHFKETGVALLGFHRVVDVWYPHLHIPPPLFPLEST
jgi:broad specificity phosphatase PhoE